MQPFWHVYQGILSAFTMSHLSRWLFSCWSTLIYQILDHETSHWFMALALPFLLPFANVCQSDISYLSSVMNIYHSRLCVLALCMLVLSSGTILTYWSHVEPTHREDAIYQRDQTVTKKMPQLLSSFPELVTWTHWCPDKWDPQTLLEATSLKFPLGYLPGILHFAHFLSVAKPAPPKSLSSS